jgi:hypothetical protein
VKRQILFCLLMVIGNTLLADEPGFPTAPQPFNPQIAEAAVPIPAIAPSGPVTEMAGPQGAPVEPLTAPPTVVGPNGAPFSSQYQPGVPMQPQMMAPPGGCPSCGGAPAGMPYGGAPYAMPYGGPPGPPGGLMQPGMGEPVWPYSAHTPDVSMAPTTVNGPLPDRYGWVQRYELGVFPFTQAKDGFDRFGEWAFDLGWKYTTPLYPAPLIFSFEQQYDLRLLSGPSSPPGVSPTNMPGSLNRIGWDFELKTAVPGPLNVVVAFTPSIDSDFQKSLTHDAFDWDGRAAFLYSPTRELTYVVGAVFWDRLHERVLPWAGVIYRPNQYWQLDLTFPQARISTYLWDEFGFKTSLYGRVEYHSEAYQIYNPVLDERDRVELNDWRALIGINKDRVDVAYFVEAGWIFGRHTDYKVSPTGFDVDSGAIIRAGVRY